MKPNPLRLASGVDDSGQSLSITQEKAPTKCNKPQEKSIYDRIRNTQMVLENEKIPNAERGVKIANMKDKSANLKKRYQIKERRALLRAIEEEEAEWRDINEGIKEQEFIKSTKPYIKEYQKQQFCRPSSQNQMLMPTNLSRETGVLDDYIVNIEGGTPRYDIQATDVCEACRENMQLYTSLSLLVCPKCGVTKQFLDATASLLAYSDDSYEYFVGGRMVGFFG